MRQILLLLCMIVAVTGCAPKDELGEIDRFMEKWQILAEENEGHSATPVERHPRRKEKVFKEHRLEEMHREQMRALPCERITLKLYNAPITGVLDALGRSVNQPILLSPAVKGTSSVDVVNQRWDQVFKGLLKNNALSYAWEGKILRVVTLDDMQKSVTIKTLKNKSREESLQELLVEPLQTSVLHIKYANAIDLKENLENLLTEEEDGKSRGTVEINEHTNTVLVRGISSDLDRVRKLVDVLDRPRKQVRLQAHIIEATKDTARELGTQWGGFYLDKDVQIGGGGSPLQPDLGRGVGGRGLITDMTSFFSSQPNTSLAVIGGNIAGNYLEMQLKALEDNRKINIISSPSITTLDNQLAFTESGERVPYESSSANEGINVQFQDAVLRLEITPHIIDDQTLRLQIFIKKDEVDTTRTVRGNPFIIRKHTETTLIVRNGETVVITGLSKSKEGRRRQSIPYLNQVPGLGRVFAGQDDLDHMEEYLIFIRPTILPQWCPCEEQVTLEEIEEKLRARDEALKK
ncbi:secretin N-terminal domain-containing protein [Halodesulfovibrio sp.]|jgi:type IV pilus assembly protein PilQ|uniref:secretin N-terminal domain-containing protein n=1 Tax=Halodesulfovibrio sp. TaxID=1912772 RepID=UPI0025E2650E|nr:secretin N-terminal domain-containing protein [Halodesulfovibrio sp.]MCT4534798.1 type IV pilus secretin PilQ [Halodesulfovibrio sp.]MCT4627890.1 type IV pilus secretin PilQ [Halodesulfovibrio sp.]